MPGLSWSSLQVVAADGLAGDRGVALRTKNTERTGSINMVPDSRRDMKRGSGRE
jgi:hypothetical protein